MEILFEDNHVIVVRKPVNIPVNLDESNDDDLLSMIKKYLKEKYDKPGNVYLGLVHRLDRPVGGVMVFAKTSKAASRLATSLQKNEFSKTYIAVVEGQAKEHQHLQDYLLKNQATNTTTVVDKSRGKIAILDYELLDFKNQLSLVKVHLQTGRSHQIRVQMSHASLPLYGDQRYNKNSKIGQQIALFAYSLSFPHPVTKEILTFTSLPDNRAPWTQFNIKEVI